MYLNMNLRDIELWEQGKLSAFAVPENPNDVVQAGDVLCVKEPFKRITATVTEEVDGEQREKKILTGAKYRSDGRTCLRTDTLDLGPHEEADRWSPASQLPEFAIRRYIHVTETILKPLSEFTEEDLLLLYLDYDSQDNPQLLIEEYLPFKNRELLYAWWRQHYQHTLRDCDDPMAVILRIEPAKPVCPFD